MRKIDASKAWARTLQIAGLGGVALLLAGCMAGYSFVQPAAPGSGGYYTSNEPNPGGDWYDDCDTGSYYMGTSDWDDCYRASPYAGAIGYGGWYYGGFGYWPPNTFGLGLSSVWGIPGYWGPWYSTGPFPWGCWPAGCGYRRHHGHPQPYRSDGHQDASDSTKTILEPERPPVPLQLEVRAMGSRGALARTQESRYYSARRAYPRQVQSSGFGKRGFVRAPIRQPVEPRLDAIPAPFRYATRPMREFAPPSLGITDHRMVEPLIPAIRYRDYRSTTQPKLRVWLPPPRAPRQTHSANPDHAPVRHPPRP